ncbi:hypothetical protein F6Y24_01505 [Xanthomonas arboricola pv. pruni]|nr:hypothetical protein F6Y24_01505 [Xanthomonas arboricola pv. pruni]RST68133.1 hypothetical protein EJK96_14125 [Xanthomonas arboricola pv. pruni]RST76849.1 hypothetical protein EJL05_15805 [Xanthomonas arboricola pv. pruni]
MSEVAVFSWAAMPDIGTTRRCPYCSHMHTDHLDWSLPTHRRGTLMYLRRVPRRRVGKSPATKP